MRSRPLPQIVLSAIAAGLVLSACAGAPDASPRAANADSHYPVKAASCGFTSTVQTKPTRAVTLNQGATEVALALGVEQHLAGTAYLDDAVPAKWAKAYDSVPVLSKEYPDHESMLATKPDFVYASYASAFDPKVAGTPAELEKAGTASYLSPFGCADAGQRPAASFEAVWDEVQTVADVFGVPERATAIRASQETLLGTLKRDDVGNGLRVLWLDDIDKTAFAGAGEGGPQVILDAIGAGNVFADVKGGWADVSWEKVVASDPDVIVLSDASWSPAKDKLAYLRKDPVLQTLRAVKDLQVVTVPFSESTPGVRLADGAAAVAAGVAKLRAAINSR